MAIQLGKASAVRDLKQVLADLAEQVNEIELYLEAGEDPTDVCKGMYGKWNKVHKPLNALRADK
jgi:hypothetical protein